MKEVVQNYHNYLTGLLKGYSTALQSPDLNDEARKKLQAGITGLETELKYVTYRLVKLTPQAEVVAAEEEPGLNIIRNVN